MTARGPGSNRTPFQREYDLERMSALYLTGKTQREIGEIIGVTQQQVNYDLKKLRKRWQESMIANINEVKNRELARIDELERTYWEAWDASRGERRRTLVTKRGTGGDDRTRAQIITEVSEGDPRFLQGVQWCVEQRCKIIGLYAPAKQEVTGEAGGPVVVSFTRWPGADGGENNG